MTTCDSLQLARAISARSRLPDSAGRQPRCGRTLHIGFFFDGFARHLEQDLKENRASNIARLFLAHLDSEYDNEFHLYRAAYLSGLGADYDASLGAQANGMARTQLDTMSDIPTDVAIAQGLEAVKDNLSGNSAWQRVKHDLNGLVDKPRDAFKVFGDVAINATAEALEPIRDSRWAAHLLKTGASTRLEGALEWLDRHISEIRASADIPLHTIKVSVFGFDFGATLARAFVHALYERCEKQGDHYLYRQARVEVVFAGLFDAIDRSAAELPPLEFFLPATNAMKDGGLIHPEVKAVLHLVAAHERRFYRRARLLGETRRHWHEELMPGVSEDVGGGIAPGDYKPGIQLALTSLLRMHKAAFESGVAIPSLEELPAKGAITASLFRLDDAVPALVRRYQRLLGAPTPGHEGFIRHMRCYIRWLAGLWHDYQRELKSLGEQEDALHQRQFSSHSTMTRLFGQTTESSHQRQQRMDETQTLRQRREALREQHSWLEEVDKEARGIKSRLSAYGARAAGSERQLEVWLALLGEWEANPPAPLHRDMDELFSRYVNDHLALSEMQRVIRSMTGELFFAIRGFDKP
jgi:hypothetical protein